MELSTSADKVVKIIRNLMTEIIKEKLEKEDGQDWFEKLKDYMIDHMNDKDSRAKFTNAVKLNNYINMDPTLCFYLMLKEPQYKSKFSFKGDEVGCIHDLVNARNSIAHSRDDGTLNYRHINSGIQSVKKAAETFYKNNRNDYFPKSRFDYYTSQTEKLEYEVDKIIHGAVKSNDEKSKKTRNIILSIVTCICVMTFIGICIKGLTSSDKPKSNNTVINSQVQQETQSTGSGTQNSYTASDADSAAQSSEKQTSGNNVLDFSQNPKVQNVTGKLAVGISKVEFNANETVVYISYDNRYKGDIIFNSVRLDVGNERADMDWMNGASGIDKIMGDKNSQIVIVLPKVQYTSGSSIKFFGQIHYMGQDGNEGLQIMNKSVDIQLN